MNNLKEAVKKWAAEEYERVGSPKSKMVFAEGFLLGQAEILQKLYSFVDGYKEEKEETEKAAE